jgi:hypothetical protein
VAVVTGPAEELAGWWEELAGESMLEDEHFDLGPDDDQEREW